MMGAGLVRTMAWGAMLAGVACLSGCAGAGGGYWETAQRYRAKFESLCKEGRFTEAAFEYEYGSNKAGYAYERRPPGREEKGIPFVWSTESMIGPLSQPEQMADLIEVARYGRWLPRLGPELQKLLARMLSRPADTPTPELIDYYHANEARLEWDSGAGAMKINVNVPPGRKLPLGFEPVKGCALSEDGFPLRITCLKDGAEMVCVPAARVWRAYTKEEGEWIVTGRFYIDRYETTNAQYLKFCKATGRSAPRHIRRWKGGKQELTGFDDPRLPVTCVRWEDALAYAKWAGKSLPTAHEWYRAAMGDEKRDFPWGAKPCSSNVAELEKYAILGREWPELGGKPEKIGGRPAGASPCGAEDMLGNVEEWALDRFEATCRTVGGRAYNDKWPLRMSYRAGPRPAYPGLPAKRPTIGFRCALPLQ